MIDLDEFLPAIIPHASGCPDPTAFENIILAAQRFCERTRLWRSKDSFQLTGECEVICTPEGSDLFEITAVAVDGCALDPISLDELNRRYPDRSEDDGSPLYFTQASPNSIMLYPSPSEGTLNVSTILRPANDAEQLPDFLLTKYRRDIADGALGEILLLPNQSFTDPARGQFFAARFAARLDELFTQRPQGQQRAPMRSKGSYF